MEFPQSLPKFFQLVWVKPNHCNCLCPLHFPSFTHRLLCISDVTHRMINRRRLGFSRLDNFFGKAQNKMVNQQNTGNLINFVSEKSRVFLFPTFFSFYRFLWAFQFFLRKFCVTLVISYVFFKFLRAKLARGCQKMYPFAHARRLTAVLSSPACTWKSSEAQVQLELVPMTRHFRSTRYF